MRDIIVTHVIKDPVTGAVLDTRTERVTGGTYETGYPKFCPYCPEMISSRRAQSTHNLVRHPA